MSRYWHIRCLDCANTHEFNDANHMEREMLVLCKYADELAGLSELSREFSSTWLSVRIAENLRVDLDWFRAHLGHELRPIDEYGQLSEACDELVECEAGHRHWCGLERGHEPPHRLIKGRSIR